MPCSVMDATNMAGSGSRPVGISILAGHAAAYMTQLPSSSSVPQNSSGLIPPRLSAELPAQAVARDELRMRFHAKASTPISTEGSHTHASSLPTTSAPRSLKNWRMPIGDTRIG
jgi:hypothetical protein